MRNKVSQGVKRGPNPGGQALQDRGNSTRADSIHIPERAAKKWRKPYTKDGADIAIARAPDNLLIKAARRFVKHHHHTALRHLLRGEPRLRAADAEQRIDCRVGPFFAFTPFVS